MEKKNTGLIVLVIILSILVLALFGYIVYDKVFNKNELPVDNKDDEKTLELLTGKWSDCSKATNKWYCNEIVVSGEDNYFSLITYETENRSDYNVYGGEIIKLKKDGKYFNLTVKETDGVKGTEVNRYIKIDISKLSDKVIKIESVDNKRMNSGDYYHGLSDYDEENTLNVDVETIKELENVFEMVYGYYASGNVYCGEIESGGHYLNELPNGNGYDNGYYKSKQFNNYQELISYLKKYMSEDVIKGRHAGTKSNYLEKNGNLYCKDLGKGGSVYQTESIKFAVSNINENEISSKVEVKLSTWFGDIDYEYYSVIYTKSNDNWIITLYEEQN